MRILVTGGSGFLGSHLCEKLVGRGHEVFVLDNLSTGRVENLSGLGVTFLSGDVEDFIWTSHEPLDQIYHLACPASPPQYQDDEVKTLQTNFQGTLNMCRLARKHKARLLFTSTSEAYGDPLEHPQRESYRGNVSTTGPRACYDEGKRVAESLMYAFQRQYGLEVRVVRIFNTFGPKLNPEDGRVVSNFVMQALRGEDLTIYGDGSQTRSFCYVADLIRGLEIVMNSDYTDPVNLGNPGEVTMLQLAELILQLTGSSSKISFHPLPKDDPTRRCPEISRAQALGWEPEITLKEGLQMMIPTYQKLIESSSSSPDPEDPPSTPEHTSLKLV